MSTLRLYQWVIKEFDKYGRHCLWRKKDMEENSQPLIACELVCKPKDQGGLGVVDPTQNNCFLMKHLHKLYNKSNLPWVKLLWEIYYSSSLPPSRSRDISFWWRYCLKDLTTFKNLAQCSIGSGSSVLLWTDVWSIIPLNLQLPHLFSFVVDENASVLQVRTLEQLSSHFHLPLSNEAFAQFQTLQDLMVNLPVGNDSDSWEVFGSATNFKVSPAYKHIVGQHVVYPAINKLRKTSCHSKHRVFFWLLLQDRLNTRQLLQRKFFFLPDYSCTMCGSLQMESRNHLFFTCPFAIMCWQYISPRWTSPTGLGKSSLLMESLDSLTTAIGKPCSLDIIILGCWSI
jgi:hypothetical protein